MKGALAAAGAFGLIVLLLPIALLVALGWIGERGLALVERAWLAMDRWAGLR